MISTLSPADYGEILGAYLHTHSEEALYRASRLSQVCIESGLGPEDIIALHFEALDGLLATLAYREQARAHGDAQQFLLEVMIAYGVKYKEYLELKLSENLRDADTRAVRERERAVEAERLQREKDEILGVIAHELRTPITAAQGNLDLASRVLGRGEVEPVPQFLSRAREAIERLSRLSADLVEASRGRPPRIDLAPRDLGSIVVQACDWARPAAASKGIMLTYDHHGAPVTVHANTDALLSVFGNLLSNSVRYTPTGGRVQVTSGSDAAEACVAVRDNGIGMTADVRARVFEKFYRGPEARTMESTGLGLGLALVQQMIQAHGGRVEVASTAGQGSSFQVFLPLRAHTDEAQEAVHGDGHAGATGGADRTAAADN
ncbi:MAG TPA: HAMP domain-containing sensor histidine kinase [Chloroflexota bacterium]|jgi:signal transduction histidine kinase|nr:HAMP domain-containing sensor histidine kinase [Chloroflexota bacterium]